MLVFAIWLFSFLLQVESQNSAITKRNPSWPDKTFAPYVDILSWPTMDVSKVSQVTGVKQFTLAFVTAGTNGLPAWGGVIAMTENFYAAQLAALRALGGDVIVSFGGANGRELGTVILNPTQLAAAYQSVIDRYNVTWVDFDIEGAAIFETASVDTRNQALAILRKNNPKLIMSYTLPTLPTGLTAAGVALLKSATKFNAGVDIINIMAMDYGTGAAPNGATGMGGYAIQAAQSVYAQAQQAGFSSPSIGVCPMIGVNDVVSEVFRLEDAAQLLEFGKKTSWLPWIAFWSVNRDNSIFGPLYKSSQVKQNDWDYCNAFKSFTTGSSVVAPSPSPSASISIPPLPSPTPKPSGTPTLNVGYQWQSRVFAPYLNVWASTSTTLTNASFTAGVTHFTIAFIVADSQGNPAFDGSIPMSQNFLVNDLAKLRLYGGDLIFSFGGASGKEIAIVNTDVAKLQQKYQNVIDQYVVSWLDFDIEGTNLGNTAANDRRNQAIAGLQKDNPLLRIAFTLAVSTSGLEPGGITLLQSAKKSGVRIDYVNIMTMDYGTGVIDMGAAALSAATGTRNQLLSLGLPDTKVGITPMIGQNDIKTEIFKQADAQKVLNFAKVNSWVGLISFWSLQRDNSIKSSNLDSSTNLVQSHLEFSKIFVQYEN